MLLWIQLKIKKMILKVLTYLKKYLIFIKKQDYPKTKKVQEIVKVLNQIRLNLKIHLE